METPRREVHPLVSLDYRVRVPAMFIVGLVLLSYFWDYPKSFWLWMAIGFTALVWPQLLYVAARLSPDAGATPSGGTCSSTRFSWAAGPAG